MPAGRTGSWLGRALAGCLLALAIPALAQAAVAGALTQYSNGSDNWATTGSVPTTYALQSTVGFLAPNPTPGTVPLYSCASGPDHFLSLDSACEGQTVLDTEGYLDTAAPTTGASSPVYSCLSATASAEDHFVSTSSTCGGALSLGLLGYVLDSAPLDRYNGGVHWVTTGSPPTGYVLEGTLGYLINAGPDTNPLYGCIQNSDQFLSKDRGCEGQTLIGLEGWIYDDPPPDVATVAVYRCSVPGSDHFAADDPGCEGQQTDGLLGYALQQPIPVPTPAATPPATTTVPQPIAPSRPPARLLHAKLRFKWRWHRASTRLSKVQIERLPATATVHITCRGKGTGCRARAVSAKPKGLRRLVHTLTGRVYHAGDRISVSVTARGYQPIKAQITIRFDKIPTVGLR
ncbi:MAG TPA: hypothetical protein VHW96_06485 [Solirubrobacteraceae bacterium]|jgi:hypothetical protein|nr:hypothetical protein [Solirubrobacteraceae bacterium]